MGIKCSCESLFLSYLRRDFIFAKCSHAESKSKLAGSSPCRMSIPILLASFAGCFSAGFFFFFGNINKLLMTSTTFGFSRVFFFFPWNLPVNVFRTFCKLQLPSECCQQLLSWRCSTTIVWDWKPRMSTHTHKGWDSPTAKSWPTSQARSSDSAEVRQGHGQPYLADTNNRTVILAIISVPVWQNNAS